MRRETTPRKIVSAHGTVAPRFSASKVTTTSKKLANSAAILLSHVKTARRAFVQTAVPKKRTQAFTEQPGNLPKKMSLLICKAESVANFPKKCVNKFDTNMSKALTNSAYALWQENMVAIKQRFCTLFTRMLTLDIQL